MTKKTHNFSYFGPGGKNSFWVPVMKRIDGQLVDAATWQVCRSTFDQKLLDGVEERGLTVIQEQVQRPLVNEDDTIRGIVARTEEEKTIEIEADEVVDASGPTETTLEFSKHNDLKCSPAIPY